MAEKKKVAKDKAGDKPPVKKKRFRFLLKTMLVLLVLLMLAGGTLWAAIYLKFFDPYALAEEYKVTEYPYIGPVIGRYLKPAAGVETAEVPAEATAAKDKPAEPAAKAAPAPLPPAATAEDVRAALAKARQEEAKRISRLARLYGEMKPDEAVPILNQLDDKTVLAILGKMEDSQVAKIMALFDAKKAARLTQNMLQGTPAQATQEVLKGKVPTT